MKIIQNRYASSVGSIGGPCMVAILLYCLTSDVAAIGLFVVGDYLHPSPHRGRIFGYSSEVYANWDGQWYTKIAAEGYSFDEASQSSVAFFPVYPLLGRLFSTITGIRQDYSLFIISNISLIVSFLLIYFYIKSRNMGDPPRFAPAVLAAMGLAPFSFFLRVCYSDSLFLCLAALTLLGMQRRWPLVVIAGIVGLATATRPVGVGLIPPLMLHVWQCGPGVRKFASRLPCLLPLACWGIIAYILYQWIYFFEPFAFVKTKAHWRTHPPATPGEWLFDLAVLEPIWRMFDPSSPGYWVKRFINTNILFCPHMADPAFFLLAAWLVAYGAVTKLLNVKEFLLSIALLILPYSTVGFNEYMYGMGRYTLAVFPAYFVAVRLLYRAPRILVVMIAGTSGIFLALYAGMFARWYMIL